MRIQIQVPNCLTCGQLMIWRGTRTEWAGEFEHTTHRFECQNACQVETTTTYRAWIGPPDDDPRKCDH